LDLYCDRLARALSVVINIVDPHAIVLGGGLSRMTPLYDRVPELWKRYIFSEPELIVTKLLPPRFGDSSGVRGAAWLWPESKASS
jgi:predicted NBD/HSP70 family sugar kinase